jgi:3-deoxy-D-manno-octulosonic-acid transferase
LKKGKEDPKRLPEKYGFSALERPGGQVLWFHALSVGESLALLPLVDRALANDEAATVVLTTSTITSVAALEKAGLPDRAVHVLLPIDTVQAVRRFLDHWRPTVAVFAELDFWPRLMFETHRRHIPMILVNSRMSAASFASRDKLHGMMRDILGLFDRLLIQDPESFDRFKLLGADPERMSVAGVLKAAARPLSADQSEIIELKASIGDRPIWLAAATCDVEEPAMIAAHRRIIENWPNALLIIAPRFLESADAVEAAARSIFQNVARRSQKELPDAQTNVYIADTIGEMGLWYRLAPVSFVGHSLGPSGKPLGGKNPYEAAALSSVILHGPAVDDFSETYQSLQETSAAILVHNEAQLSQSVARLFDAEERAPLVEAAREVIKARRGVLETTWSAILQAL